MSEDANKNSSIVRSANDPEESGSYEPRGLAAIRALKPLDPNSFPNPPRGKNGPLPCTLVNIEYMLSCYGIVVRYNVIKKKVLIIIPGCFGAPDNADNVALTHVISLANLNGIGSGPIMNFVDAIADFNLYNPVVDWVTSRPWDGVDRLPDIYATLIVREDYPDELKKTLLRRWLLSCVAAAFKPSGFLCRGVLTIQGTQSSGKTNWIRALVDSEPLAIDLIKIGHHMDALNKDQVLSAISHWIVEIGELDSTFRKDIAALKGFITNSSDKVRRPYGRADSEYPRRTVFAATVNEQNFFVDTTGNTRFWVLPIKEAKFNHGINMQQLFAQMLTDYERGEQWWLTPSEQELLDKCNAEHRHVSVIREELEARLDLSRKGDPDLPPMTATEVLKEIGYKDPKNPQAKECAGVLREHLGDCKKINGIYKWRVPLKDREEFVAVNLIKTPKARP